MFYLDGNTTTDLSELKDTHCVMLVSNTKSKDYFLFRRKLNRTLLNTGAYIPQCKHTSLQIKVQHSFMLLNN